MIQKYKILINGTHIMEDYSIKLYAMTCGWVTMPYGFFFAGKSGGYLAVPIQSYYIEHPKGTVLFDTGLETNLQSEDPEDVKQALGAYASLISVQYHAHEDIKSRLEAFGVDPAKINYVINSHLHFDHCGGNVSIPNARIIVQKREWQAAKNEENIEKQIYYPKLYDLGHDRLEIEGEHDLFGDGGVVLFPSYGHTPGHQSLKIKLEGKEVVLTGDACYLKKALETMTLPDALVVNDAENMKKSFELFKKLQSRGAKIIFGHDPEQSLTLTDGPIKQVTLRELI
nr:N-acyl homoserine lactonase family protein [Acinetobacter sp. Marseille-Q1620]